MWGLLSKRRIWMKVTGSFKWKLLLFLTVLTCAGCLREDKSAANEFVIVNKNNENLAGKLQETEGDDQLTMEIPGSPVRRLIDPHSTWLAFMRHSERTNQRQRSKNARRTKKLSGLRGPAGPQGPQGPQGLPGAQITKDVLLEEFQALVREAAERRIQNIIDAQCKDCGDKSLEKNVTGGAYVPPLFDIQEVSLVTKLIWGFHCRLEDDVKIARHVPRMELKTFYVPFVQGGFQRGDGINPQKGRFTVPRDGVYSFVANLHAKHRSSRKRRMLKSGASVKTGTDVVRAMICINSKCLQEASLETILQLTHAPWRGSIIVNGFLELQKGQYVSIYIDNSESEAIVIQDSSYFSGSLIGL